DRDVRVAAGRFDDDAKVFKDCGHVYAEDIGVIALAELEAGHVAEAFDECGKSAHVFVVLEESAAGEPRVNHTDRAAEIAELVAHCAFQHSRTAEHLLQAKLLTVAQLFAGVEHYGGESKSQHGAIGGEPDSGKEELAAVPPPVTLHRGAKERSIADQRNRV